MSQYCPMKSYDPIYYIWGINATIKPLLQRYWLDQNHRRWWSHDHLSNPAFTINEWWYKRDPFHSFATCGAQTHCQAHASKPQLFRIKKVGQGRSEPGSMRLFYIFFFYIQTKGFFRTKKVGHSRFWTWIHETFFQHIKQGPFSEWRRWDRVDLNLDPRDFSHTDQGPFQNEESRPRWGTVDLNLAQQDFLHTNHGPLTWANLAHGQHCHHSWCNLWSWSKHDRKNNALSTVSPWQNWKTIKS